MIAIAFMILGGVYGVRRAAAAGGDRFDKLQYGAVFTVIGAILGLFTTIAVERMF